MILFKYIGSPARISHCPFCGNKALSEPHEVCVNGSCPGFVDKECPFADDVTVSQRFERLFVAVGRFKYVGPKYPVTPCEWVKNPKATYAVCSGGSCPGVIDGACPFHGEDLKSRFVGFLFVEDEG